MLSIFLHHNTQQSDINIKIIVSVFKIKALLTWLPGWVTGGGCLDSIECSVSPFVWTISVGPLVALFSMMGIRSRRAGLHAVKMKEIREIGPNCYTNIIIFRKKCYLIWSYFLKSALYSTALCWSSTSMLLPYIETTFLIRLKHHLITTG